MLLLNIVLVLALVTPPGLPWVVSEQTTHVIDGKIYLCVHAPFEQLNCRPATSADTVCIPDTHSGDGKGCHIIDLRKGFNP